MLQLSKLKKRSERESSTASKQQRTTVARMRMTKDISDLNLPPTCQLDFPNPDEISSFQLTITPDEGFYRNYRTTFDFQLPEDYPYAPPKVKCETPIYHPNIDGEGNVCLNILREDWKPVLSIDSVVYGLQHLLLEPNPGDALNEVAARQLQDDFPGFILNVKNVAKGRVDAKSIGRGMSEHGHASGYGQK